MKKRYEQKLVILSGVLFLVLNVPIIMTYNSSGSVLGFPLLYFMIFMFWILSVIASFIILKKYHG